MGFTKFQSVDKAEVVSREGHAKIEDELHKLGKTSAKTLTPEERIAALKPE